MKLTSKILRVILALSMLLCCMSFAAFDAGAATSQDFSVTEFCLADSSGTELDTAPFESEDNKLYLSASITNQTTDDKAVFLVIASYKSDALCDISLNAFSVKAGEKLDVQKGSENTVSAKLLDDTNIKYKIFAWDAETLNPLTDAKAYKDKDKIIFIGNSLTYYGGTVLDGTQNTTATYLQKRFGDTGYFYQMAKQNNMEMHVTNWTWGGHGIDDIFGTSCAADRGHDGHNHYADLLNYSNMKYDYVVLQPTNRTCITGDVFEEQIGMIKDAFKTKSPNAKYFALIPTTYYVGDTDAKKAFRNSFPEVQAETGVKILPWGKLVNELINGTAVVENATQTYNKNSFIVSTTQADGYHPNQLTGYITTQYVFSTITGKKAEGERYAFCTDSTINASFSVSSFLSKYYKYDNISSAGTLKGDALTTYPEILSSPTDMLGIQKLIDIYRKQELQVEEIGGNTGGEGGEDPVEPEDPVNPEQVKKAIFLGNSLTYIGQTVLDGTQNVDATSLGKRFEDKGYFYQLAKQNDISMHVVNWTWGGHSLAHMLSESCAADRGHDGHNHLAALQNNTDMKFDYVIYQPTKSYTKTEAALQEDIALLKSTFGAGSPDAKYIILIPSPYYTDTTDAIAEFRACFADVEDETGVEFVPWGDLVVDIINGNVTVENATQTYNKYSFMISVSSSDGYNPNQLTGYITAQYLFSLLTEEKAEGESYAFCTDTSVNAAFSLSSFLTTYYKYDYNKTGKKGDALTTYPEILASSADMLGIQKLLDRYVSEKPYRTAN